MQFSKVASPRLLLCVALLLVALNLAYVLQVQAAGRQERPGRAAAVASTADLLLFVILTAAINICGKTRRECGQIAGNLANREELLRKSSLELGRLHQEKVKTQQRFQLELEASPTAMIALGGDGLIALANPQMEKLFGYARSELLGRRVEMLTPERFRASHRADWGAFPAAPASRAMGVDRDLFGLRKDGSELPIEINLSPIGIDGRPRVLAAITDITERKRFEADLQARASEMERFAYTVSHDLKSPLITIKSYAAIIDQELAAGNVDSARSDLQRVGKAAAKMQILLEDVLAFSRVGRTESKLETAPFAGLVAEALELTAGRTREKNIRVEVAPDLPLVAVDRPRIVEVLQNLIDNAAKFMDGQPEPAILIGASNGGAETRFFVKDNGPGVDARYHTKIFGLFDKLNPKSEGSGAGLAIAKRIVEMHGGRIWIESAGGGGSTFWFTLPQPAKMDRQS